MFAHLHTHSEYSLLDGLCRIPDLVQQAKDLGLGALALTDHGSLYGAVHFYKEARAAGIKPIIGVEGYVAPQGRHSRLPGDKQPYHLVLLARNQEGYHNLLKLVTIGHLEGFYYRPRMDREVLEKYGGGLIALSGCLGGEVPRALMEGRWDDAREAALWHKKTFDGYYLELQRHEGIEDLGKLNQALIALSKELDIPLVATNDLHYVRREDSEAQDVLLCIQTNATVQEQNRMKMDDDSFYLKSEAEMRDLFSDMPEAVDNAWAIAEMCNLELEFNRLHLPQIDIPEGKSSYEYLEQLCWEGYARRYKGDDSEARARLVYELDVVRQMEFSDYFLVVWDIVAYARQQGILVGVRGSAAASAVLYCLNITEIEPLEYSLVFERFLNLERKEMPDIDLDIEDARRDEVLGYVMRRFGQDRVAQIITFGTLGAKAAIRDVGRALAMPYADVDAVARLLPTGAHPIPLDEAMEQVPAFRDSYQQNTQVRKLVDTARHLEGVARHASTHAAGVVISQEPLSNVVPLQRPTRTDTDDAMPMTQWDMNTVAEVGLLKMDFLGLSNLTILARTRDLIAETRGEKIDLQDLPLDDPKTFELLCEGETTGLFQLEGSGMRRWIKQLKPQNLKEVSAMIALYRPGPMEHIPRFIAAKFGSEPITYPHDDLSEILAETYGVIVYQDQVLKIAQKFAGYSLGQADIVRKAMGKKIASIMTEEREGFIKGALDKGYSQEDSEAVFDLIEPFAGYAFNKAHSVSYAYIAYQTAYFKANYPVEYMTSLFNSSLGQQERMGTIADECTLMGITVGRPDVSLSDEEFSIEEDTQTGQRIIHTGLAAVKNVGRAAVEMIVTERRDHGPFASLDDFISRSDLRSLNRRALESLIRTGALDSFGARGVLAENAERILALSLQETKRRESQQGAMFDMMADSDGGSIPTLVLDGDDVANPQKAAWEKELVGIYFTEDPYSALRQAAGKDAISCGEITVEMAGQRVTIAGIVNSLRNFVVRGESAGSVALQDLSGSVDVTIWPDKWRTTGEMWQANTPVIVEGLVRTRNDRVSVNCDKVRGLVLDDSLEEETVGYESENREPALVAAEPGLRYEAVREQVENTTPARATSSTDSTEPSIDPDPNVVSAPTNEPSTADASSEGRPETEKPAAVEAASSPSTNGNSSGRRFQLVLQLKETPDEAGDLQRLKQVLEILRSHPGQDPVRLIVHEAEADVPLDLPHETSYGPEMASEIAGILGENALTAQQMLM